MSHPYTADLRHAFPAQTGRHALTRDAFEEKRAALEPHLAALRDRPAGSVVGPFQTEGGWAVLRVEDRRKETPPTLEQARPQIVRYLTYDGVRRLLEQLRGKSKVDVLLPASPAASVPPTPASPSSAPVPAA